jgi:hypothetical protein
MLNVQSVRPCETEKTCDMKSNFPPLQKTCFLDKNRKIGRIHSHFYFSKFQI